MSTGITVVICCYNSVSRLPDTLRHLHAQNIPIDIPVEILIVDNNSNDNTAQFSLDYWLSLGESPFNFRVTWETKPGQMYARGWGVWEAEHDSIVFCDDDNWLNKEYIYQAHLTLQHDPSIGAVGGQNIPVTDASNYPDWFEEYKDKYALGIPATQSGDISSRGFVLGAGMATRKELWLEMFDNNFPSLLKGRNGEELSTGDDFEYCKRLLLRNYKLYYNEAMILKHFIPRQRLTIEYRERLMKGIAEAGEVLDKYDEAIYVKRVIVNKNRWRLLLMAPYRILACRLGVSSRVLKEEQLRLFYLCPLSSSGDPVKNSIKKFINHKVPKEFTRTTHKYSDGNSSVTITIE